MSMITPIIGWNGVEPVPNHHTFSRYLKASAGKLLLDGVALVDLFSEGLVNSGALSSPLEIVYLPIIRDRIKSLITIFEEAIRETNYQGKFLYAYASKANAAEEVVRTILGTGVNYEISSWIDVEILRYMREKGVASGKRWVICNGFKQSGSQYSREIIRLQKERRNVLPVIEDHTELGALIEANVLFDVGVRMKSYGVHKDLAAMDAANSRFGMDTRGIIEAAQMIRSAPNLRLILFHAMVGSQMKTEQGFVDCLAPAIDFYASLRKEHDTLEIFDFGGGMPVQMTLDFYFDYRRFAHLLLTTIQETCLKHNVPVPDVMGEFGRYTVAEHGAHTFKVLSSKDNRSALPWYIIDGSVMSSFPDSWALGEHFIVLPLNHLDKPFQQVQIGGITCDSDDVYPPKSSHARLYLPTDTNDLYVGFFNIGAYQEMLGGAGGSKHCVIPEANELIIDQDQSGAITYEKIPGQSAACVLRNLGYR